MIRASGLTYTRRMKRTLLLLALLVLLPGMLQAQVGWGAYKPRSLQSIIEMNQGLAHDLESDTGGWAGRFLLTGDNFPSTVTLVYLGKSRPIAGKRLDLLKAWAKSMGRTDEDVAKFGTEMLFREGHREYWIAVQKPLVGEIKTDAAGGIPIEGFIMWMGAVQVDDHWEWLFAMNRFDNP